MLENLLDYNLRDLCFGLLDFFIIVLMIFSDCFGMVDFVSPTSTFLERLYDGEFASTGNL